MTAKEHLTLKWGTIKAYNDFTEKSQEIVGRYFADGMSMSCALERPDDDRKAILCELIEQLDGEIYLDWDGKYVTKNEAKKYVLQYGRK